MAFNGRVFASILAATSGMFCLPVAAQTIEDVLAADTTLTPEMINNAPLEQLDPISTGSVGHPTAGGGNSIPSAGIVRLQVLLDAAGASPGVIDGLDGSNLRGAIAGFEMMRGLSVDGELDAGLIDLLDTTRQVIGSYVITADDLASILDHIPEDYAEQAKINYLDYTSVAEKLAERFHMDIELLHLLNPASDFAEGQTIFVADLGPDRQGHAARLEVDKSTGQVRAYGGNDVLIAAYPATIGSESNPSPSGTHKVAAVVSNPTYTYNPKLNFQQGQNDAVLTLPPGPNGPVGSVWIDLSEPTYGIHGTPDPAKINKTGSHGCVRLTNWDAEELAAMLTEDVSVTFLD